MAWILRLEDQRILRNDLPAPPPPPPPGQGGRKLTPSSRRRRRRRRPILTVLVRDGDARIRRRAALAIGRVGLAKDGVRDAEPAAGGYRSRRAADGRLRARADRRRHGGRGADAAAERSARRACAGAPPRRWASSAPRLGRRRRADGRGVRVEARASRRCSRTTRAWPTAPEAEAFKLGLFALVRLKAYEPLAAAVLDAAGRSRTWWPVAFRAAADQRSARARRRSSSCAAPGRYTPRLRGARPGRAKGRRRRSSRSLALLDQARRPARVTVSAIRALAQIGAPEAAEPISRLAGAPKGASERAARSGRRRSATLKGAAALPSPGSAHRRLAGDARGGACAPRPPSIRRASGRARGHGARSDWRVRAAIADVLATLPAEIATDRLRAMLTGRGQARHARGARRRWPG